jgi:hypothetical protein
MPRWLNLLLLCFAPSALGTAPIPPSQIAITHITIIDVRDGSRQQDMSVLISGDRIGVIGSSKKVQLPKQTRVIDGHGKFLIPGLWDMHVHTDGEDRVLRLLLAYGITGIRDMAGDPAKLADARRRITSGELTGPRLVFAGPMLEGPPSQADDWTWIIHSSEEARMYGPPLLRKRNVRMSQMVCANVYGLCWSESLLARKDGDRGGLAEWGQSHGKKKMKVCLDLNRPSHGRN